MDNMTWFDITCYVTGMLVIITAVMVTLIFWLIWVVGKCQTIYYHIKHLVKNKSKELMYEYRQNN